MFPSLSQKNGAYTWLADVIPTSQFSLHDPCFVQVAYCPYIVIGKFRLAMRFSLMDKLAEHIKCVAHVARLGNVLKIVYVVVAAVAVNMVDLYSISARPNKSRHDKSVYQQIMPLIVLMQRNSLVNEASASASAVEVSQIENSLITAPLVVQALNAPMIRYMVSVFKANNRTPDFVRHFDPHFAKDSHDETRQFAVSNKGSGATLVA
jgi:hypothetical protein